MSQTSEGKPDPEAEPPAEPECKGCQLGWPVAQVGDVAIHIAPTEQPNQTTCTMRCTALKSSVEPRCQCVEVDAGGCVGHAQDCASRTPPAPRVYEPMDDTFKFRCKHCGQHLDDHSALDMRCRVNRGASR